MPPKPDAILRLTISCSTMLVWLVSHRNIYLCHFRWRLTHPTRLYSYPFIVNKLLYQHYLCLIVEWSVTNGATNRINPDRPCEILYSMLRCPWVMFKLEGLLVPVISRNAHCPLNRQPAVSESWWYMYSVWFIYLS